ncbi:uncharacterized protein, partial [Primulina huaijiensis]|uniref:uncharacterized protein n=1 Tax=Primulina huaijiensis TaxID=1492673 RepID=UPI003CC736EE
MSVRVTSQTDRYNKRVEDFTSLREYNDYLEEVEDMIVNLSEGIDVPAIEVRIAQYQRENAEQIMNAQARKAEEYAAALTASRGQLVQTGVDVVVLFTVNGALPIGGNDCGLSLVIATNSVSITT